LKAERNSSSQTFDHHKKEKIVFTIKRGIKKFLSVSHRHPWVGHSHLATQTNNIKPSHQNSNSVRVQQQSSVGDQKKRSQALCYLASTLSTLNNNITFE